MTYDDTKYHNTLELWPRLQDQIKSNFHENISYLYVSDFTIFDYFGNI